MDKTGLDTQFQSVFLPLMVADDDKELDGIAQFFGKFEIPAGDIFNASDVNFIRGNGCSVGQHRQDERLVGGIPAIDVQGRVFFREAQLLGLGQGVRVIGPVFPHGGKNIVGRSVNNAYNGIDVVANQGILQALDNGDAAAGGRFEINGGAHFRGELENLRSVLGQKSFVPRNDGLAGPEGLRHQVVSLARPSNQLNNDVYFRVIDQILPIVRQQFPGNDGFPGLFQVAHGDALEPERNLAPGFQQGVIAAQRFINAGTDRSQPGKPQLYRFFRHSCRGIMQKNPCNARAFTVPECRMRAVHGVPLFPAFSFTSACFMRGSTAVGFSRILRR